MPPITPLRTLDRTASTFKADCDVFFGSEMHTFSVEAEAARLEVIAKEASAVAAAGTATTKADLAIAAAGAAINAPNTSATSTTSMTNGTVSQAFTLVETGKAFAVGQWVTRTDTGAPTTNWSAGVITAFNASTGAITVNFTVAVGSGTSITWGVSASSPVQAKDVPNGVPGLTSYKINMVNVAGTYTSYQTNTNTASRTYTWQDRDGTVADLNGMQVFSGAQRGLPYALTDAATIALDLSLGNTYEVTLGGNRTLAVPINGAAGQQGIIDIYQDNTGSRTLALSWFWSWFGGSIGQLSTSAYAHDVAAYAIHAFKSATATMTIATPCVVTVPSHGLKSGHKCQMTTTGALPTGLAASTTYWVHVIDANTFHLSTSLVNCRAGTYIATSGSQSGVHSFIGGKGTLSYGKDSQ